MRFGAGGDVLVAAIGEAIGRLASGPDAACTRAKARSLAVWNRFSGLFSRQCPTSSTSSGASAAFPDGSSRRIAAIVSATVPRWNAFSPVSISWSTDPREKTSERLSTGRPFTCSGDM